MHLQSATKKKIKHLQYWKYAFPLVSLGELKD